MTREELIQKLLKCKADMHNMYCDLDSVVSEVVSDICDYDWPDNDYQLDSYTYTYDTIDGVEEFIKATLKDWWIVTLKNRLSEVDCDCDWFRIDDVDWTIYCRDYWDVEEWIDDILSELDYKQDETSD